MHTIKLAFVRAALAVQRAVLWLLCAVLFVGRFPPSSLDPKRILMYRTGALGDFLFAVPAMVALRKRFPAARIMLVTIASTQKEVQTMVSGYADPSRALPWIGLVYPKHVDEVLCLPGVNPIRVWRDVRPRVREFRPDLSFMLSYPAEGGIPLAKKIALFWLMGVTTVPFGWRTRASYRFMRGFQHAQGMIEHKIHGPRRALMEFPGFGEFRAAEIAFELDLGLGALDRAERIWREHDLSGKKVVAIAPGSLKPHKQWPIENYCDAAEALSKMAKDSFFIVTGVGSDRSLGEMISNRINGRCVNLAGALDIAESGALLKRCSLMIGNDGGAVHLATAVGCPCVTIANGIEDPGNVEPWFSKEGVARCHVDCAPCYDELGCPKGKHVCVTGINVDQVVGKALKALNGRSDLPSTRSIR